MYGFPGFYKKLIKIKLNSTAIILNSYSFLKLGISMLPLSTIFPLDVVIIFFLVLFFILFNIEAVMLDFIHATKRYNMFIFQK
jgi:hypothetical protein